MSDPVPARIVCCRCRAVLEAADHYCRHCGAPAAPQPAWWESPWMVLPMLFVVLGPFALPLLWKSRRFTLPWKAVLTVVVLGVTVFAVWLTWYSVHQALAPLLELEKFQRF